MVSGFRCAFQLRLSAFEFDVHLAADNQLVVIHDPTVDRTTNGCGLVAALTTAELAKLKARAVFSDWPESDWVPTLHEVLDVVAGAEHLEIEIKTGQPVRLRRVDHISRDCPSLAHSGLRANDVLP